MARKLFTKEEIKQLVIDENVEFIRVTFTDVLGAIKNVEVPTSQLDKLLNNNLMFDGYIAAYCSTLISWPPQFSTSSDCHEG